MPHGDGFTESDREAVLTVLGEEQRLKAEGKPYREAVIVACEWCLRATAKPKFKKAMAWGPNGPMSAEEEAAITRAQAGEDFNEPTNAQRQVSANNPFIRENYWWNKD